MKTSSMEVHDMLSVFSVDEVEKRISEVPGVESVTVNFAAGNATVRYDETRLNSADIKSAVRQRGFEPASPAAGSAGNDHEGPAAESAPPATTPPAVPATSPGTTAADGAAAPDKVATAASSTAAPAAEPEATAGDDKQDKAAPDKG